MLVANKIDDVEKRVVTSEQGVEFAELNQMVYKETSALNGQGVNELFEETTI